MCYNIMQNAGSLLHEDLTSLITFQKAAWWMT